MNELPEFWRTEIWHPLFVHFPLAVLILGSLFIVISTIIKKNFWEDMSKILLVIGTFGIWIVIYTGNLADSVVSRQICDPTVLKTHEINANIVGWIFSIVSTIIIFEYFGFFKKIKNLLKIILIVLSIMGSGILIYTGHLGATLVYQQAAAVHIPSEDCNEFTD
ncbi:MAG: hypothetical protein PF517_12935 [Salinivirgaceae bacterium]|jgi:uncharacterized membrane protein|nr:hypothetical protein [Salinivirgaceae bacterium]